MVRIHPSIPLTSSQIGVQDVISSVQELPVEDETSQELTVYVTKTGKKYHLGSCSSLRRSKIPISLKEAKARYSPCLRCGPPQSLLNEELKKLSVPSIDRSVERLDRAWLNRIYPNANKASTTKVSSGKSKFKQTKDFQ